MLRRALLSLPFALAWGLISGQFNPGGLLFGFGVSFVVLTGLGVQVRPVKIGQIPGQVAAFVIYVLLTLRDIFLSSIDVARRILSPSLRMEPGIIPVPTQDPLRREWIAALSAHNITVTPGQLVVDFDDSEVMYVHCLDVTDSARTVTGAQALRLKLLTEMIGESEDERMAEYWRTNGARGDDRAAFPLHLPGVGGAESGRSLAGD